MKKTNLNQTKSVIVLKNNGTIVIKSNLNSV